MGFLKDVTGAFITDLVFERERKRKRNRNITIAVIIAALAVGAYFIFR